MKSKDKWSGATDLNDKVPESTPFLEIGEAESGASRVTSSLPDLNAGSPESTPLLLDNVEVTPSREEELERALQEERRARKQETAELRRRLTDLEGVIQQEREDRGNAAGEQEDNEEEGMAAVCRNKNKQLKYCFFMLLALVIGGAIVAKGLCSTSGACSTSEEPAPVSPVSPSQNPSPAPPNSTYQPTLSQLPTPSPSISPSASPTQSPSISPSESPTDNPFELMAFGNGDLKGVWFPDKDHLLVVDSMTARKINSTDAVASYQSPREITVATHDGTYLVIADRAQLTALNSSTLEIVSNQNLVQTCESGVMLDDHKFVCGPSNDWDRVFIVYDVVTGTQFSTSGKYTYNGIPMKRVPGQPAFITVTTSLSPSDFHLYNATNGTVKFIAGSPYHGDFSINNVYAFAGFPASHLITHQGIMLRIFGPDNQYCTYNTCLLRDGELGVFDSSSHDGYVQMTQNAKGTRVYGLLDPDSSDWNDIRCEEGCVVQEVDIDGRMVLRNSVTPRRSYQRTGLVLAHDPFTGSVLLGAKLENEEKYEIRKILWTLIT